MLKLTEIETNESNTLLYMYIKDMLILRGKPV